MADYFSEYSTLAGNKRLPSPADTPYETPGYLRSKRSSRVGSSREQSTTPPPLPSDSIDAQEKTRDGHYSAVDPRRFTPTLHASLVSEILNLRREIDSKNNLVENLETALSQTKDDNESLASKLSESAKEIRKAKQQVQQMEKGTLDVVEDLAKERDAAKSAFHEIRSKFEVTQKKTRVQDDDAVRAQSIWESEKESWDNERRQLERRVHVTESRLRAVLDEMASQQSQAMQTDETGDDSAFKDSGLGDGSDTASIRSAAPASPDKHRRNMSSISFRPKNMRSSVSSRGTAATPDLYGRSGNTLADELGIDEEDEYDADEYENDNGEVDFDYAANVQRAVESRQSLRNAELDLKAKCTNGLAEHTSDDATFSQDSPGSLPESRSANGVAHEKLDRAITPPPVEAPSSVSRVEYVDSGYQPSPPHSPPRVVIALHDDDKSDVTNAEVADRVRPADIDRSLVLQQPVAGLETRVVASPISPPQTPVVDDGAWPAEKAAPDVAPVYHTASTQTELVEQQTQPGHTPKQDSLSASALVPSIAIHPPSSRPSSPRPYALPPGTKNAASQANINCAYRDAGMQTAEIRVDKRPVKLAAHLLPSHLLPSPPLSDTTSRPKRVAPADAPKTFTKTTATTSTPASAPSQLPVDPSTDMARSPKDLRSHPLKAIPLPRPVLSPLASPSLAQVEAHGNNGPLNRSSQYGVSQPRLDMQPLARDVEHSDLESPTNEFDADFASSIPGLSRPPPGRFGLSEPPKAVPEDKEISPERRPSTAGSYGPVAGPSFITSRPASQPRHNRQTSKSGRNDARKDPRSRSPSFGSMASSSQSAPIGVPMPPFPIPLRRSSRTISKPQSEGSQSPTPYDYYSGHRAIRAGPSNHNRQVSLRKVQSAAIIRTRSGRVSPKKGHRQRRRTPDLTPVQSMAFEDPPMPTDFPIPDLPTPLQDGPKYIQSSLDMSTSVGSATRASEETNLVDAIAGTMVGEWMWKYIRKRKSFPGIGDDTDMPVADQNGFVGSTGHGTRHKRWVWLSPYERTIMWDSKQPTSGPALLGKKGRKLAIQSVLDVQDLSALPKNPELGTAWNRSILILTPERALKFTATTQERHRLWMAALSFLAQSQSPNPQDLNSIPRTFNPPPPLPSTSSFDGVPIKRYRAPSFGKATVRDSIRLAKGRKLDYSKNPDMSFDEDGADFPSVPRLYITTSRHQRKRSYTNPGVQLPNEKFRSLSSGALQSSHGGSTNGSSYRPSASSKSGSQRDSIASPDRPNFFEAVGTVRMEAFVDPNVRDGVLYVPAPPPNIGGAPRRRRHERDMSQSTVDNRRAGSVFDYGESDPFHGF